MKNVKGATYDKNREPMVAVTPTEKPFKQGDRNLPPVTRPSASKSAYGKDVMPKNKVTGGSSARVQKAGRLPGRVGDGNENRALSS